MDRGLRLIYRLCSERYMPEDPNNEGIDIVHCLLYSRDRYPELILSGRDIGGYVEKSINAAGLFIVSTTVMRISIYGERIC